MAKVDRCPQCGCDMPPDSPAGLCPDCLLRAGLAVSDPFDGDQPLTEASPRSSFVPPKPHELADRFPQFEILDLLGYGGMGAVYKARQKSLDRLVALKIIKPDAADNPGFAGRFEREAKALAKLNHSHIVSVYDFGKSSHDTPHDGNFLYYFVMEYVDGMNLRRLIESKELEPEQAMQIIPQICDALQFAHDEGIVHRDIKPENILVDSKGRVKIADFGLAKLLGKTAIDEDALTGTHQVMGTPRYMAPEQMEGSKTVDHRADIYSLGVVFYEMLTGELPMGSFEPPSRKVHVDVRLDEIVLRSMAREPERRYQHASDVKTDVESVSSSQAAVQPVARSNREQRTGSLATSASGEYTAQEDGVRTAVLLILFLSSIAGVSLMFMPWSEVHLRALVQIPPSAPEVGPIESIEVAGYHHWLPILGALLSLALFIFTLVQTLFGQFPSAPRAMLAAAAGLMLALSGAMIFALAPLTNHPDHYAPLAKSYGFKVSDNNDAIAYLLYVERVPQAVDLRVDMDGPGPYLAMFVGVALMVASLLEMRLVLAPQPAAIPPQLDELLRGPATALRWTAWASPLAIPVLIAMNLAYGAQTPSADWMQFDSAAAEAALSVDSYDKYQQYKILGELPSVQIVLIVLLVTQILHAIFVTRWILTGASRMQQLSSHRSAKRASIAAMLPLGVTFVVGVPVGIWSLIVLAREEVTIAFDEGARKEKSLERPPFDQALWPAIGLIFTGLLGCGLAITLFVLLATGVVKGVPWAEAAGAMSPILFVGLWAPTLLAGVFMLRRQAYGFVFAYAVLSIIFSPLNLLGLPFGIWAITALLHDDVKDAFGVKKKQPKEPKPIAAEEAEEEDEEEEESPQEKLQAAAWWVGAVGAFRGWTLLSESKWSEMFDSLGSAQFDVSREMLLGLSGPVILIAAIGMYHARFYWFAVTACVLCLLSGSVPPLIVGVWSLIVLFDPQVRALFLANDLALGITGSASEFAPTGLKPPLQHGDGDARGSTLSEVWIDWWRERDALFTRMVQAILMLLHLGCLFAFLSFTSQVTMNDEGQRMFKHEIGFPSPWFTTEATSGSGFSFNHELHWPFSAGVIAACGGGLAYVLCRIERVRNPVVSFWYKPEAFALVWCVLALADIGLGVGAGQLTTNLNQLGRSATLDAAGTGSRDQTGLDTVETTHPAKSPELEVKTE